MSRKSKKPKRTKEYYMRKKQFLSSCSDAFGVMCVVAFIMILSGTFDRLFPFGIKGLYGIFIIDTLCIIMKWTYYKKAIKAGKEEKNELSGS